MKSNLYRSAAVGVLALAGACNLSGHSGASNAVENRPVEVGAASSAGDAKTEPAAAEHQRVGRMFAGSIGAAKVELDIKREGDALSGSYFYRKSGSANRLSLKGSVAKDGTFTMQESDTAGKQTGTLKGKWADDPNDVGISLEGEWLKPGQTSGGQAFFAFEQVVDFKSTQIAAKEIKESIKAKKADITAEYPELSGNANAAGFNKVVKTAVTKAIDGFKEDMAELKAADIKNMSKDMSNYVEVVYNVDYADEDLISVNFDYSTFEGGAHPNHDTFTITYDLKAGKEVDLADLFQPGAKYLETISAYTMKDLKARKDPESGENMGVAQDVFEDGAKPTAENYANWNITKKGLMITFPPYQVAAYAYGPQTVIVPVSELKSIMKADGALTKAKR